MKKLILIMILPVLVACSSSDIPTGGGLFCVSIEAATLIQVFSATTLVEGVVVPTDSNGDPIFDADQYSAALAACFSDPQSQLLLEAIQAAAADG